VDWPGENATAGDVWVALDGQTGRLDQANDRTASAIVIVERCEKRDQDAVERATAPWYRRIFGAADAADLSPVPKTIKS
jgi:hypothetical protein